MSGLKDARLIVVKVGSALLVSDDTGKELDAAVTEGLVAVTLPKAANAGEIIALHDLLSYHEGKAGLPHGSVSILPLRRKVLAITLR